MRPLNVLLMGYNGANNTGAEALLLADIQDIRAVLGPGARLTIPSLNPANLRRYVHETPNLRIAPIPSVYFIELWRLVRKQDLVLLVEGSAYMDTWTSALLWAFLWVTHCAHQMRKPCLAYAVDAGQLKPLNQRLVRRVVSETELVVVRSHAAADRLRAWGVTSPMETTADNALTFQPDPADRGILRHAWPASALGAGVAGLALVDFNLFPVVIRPWGRPSDCYRWPYYFSRSADRRRASAALAQGYARLADSLVDNRDLSIALVCMEELDERLATEVQARMRQPERARIFSSHDLNASQMTLLLRELDLLVTSRYHACVLSLAAAVPQVAVGHDLRLKTLYRELGLEANFVQASDEHKWTQLENRVDTLLHTPEEARQLLRRGYAEHLDAARRNRTLLRQFVEAHGYETEPAWPMAA